MDIIHSEYVQQKVKVHLKPSVQLIANVVQTKTLQAGESLSYRATYHLLTQLQWRYLDMQMAIYA